MSFRQILTVLLAVFHFASSSHAASSQVTLKVDLLKNVAIQRLHLLLCFSLQQDEFVTKAIAQALADKVHSEILSMLPEYKIKIASISSTGHTISYTKNIDNWRIFNCGATNNKTLIDQLEFKELPPDSILVEMAEAHTKGELKINSKAATQRLEKIDYFEAKADKSCKNNFYGLVKGEWPSDQDSCSPLCPKDRPEPDPTLFWRDGASNFSLRDGLLSINGIEWNPDEHCGLCTGKYPNYSETVRECVDEQGCTRRDLREKCSKECKYFEKPGSKPDQCEPDGKKLCKVCQETTDYLTKLNFDSIDFSELLSEDDFGYECDPQELIALAKAYRTYLLAKLKPTSRQCRVDSKRRLYYKNTDQLAYLERIPCGSILVSNSFAAYLLVKGGSNCSSRQLVETLPKVLGKLPFNHKSSLYQKLFRPLF